MQTHQLFKQYAEGKIVTTETFVLMPAKNVGIIENIY